MGTDSMEVNFNQIEAVVAGQGDGIANRLQECAIENFAEELNIEGPKMGDLNDDHIVSKKIHKFYFVKFCPYNDPEESSKIEKAEKFIQKMDREDIPLKKSYCTKGSQLHDAYSQLNRLRNQRSKLDVTMGWKQEILNDLEEALDKLNFQINSYKRDSTSPSDPNFHVTRHLRILHGSSMKLAKERELLKQISISRNQLQADADIPRDSICLKKRLSQFIRWQGEIRSKNFLEEFKRLEEKKEKTIATASLKGRIWDPWTSRTTIQEYITLMKNLSEEMKKQDREIIAEIPEINKEIDDIREELWRLGRQRRDIYLKKQEAEKFLLKLKKRHREANANYNEYTSLMNKAMELARKKDVEAIQQLSRVEVDKFMTRWNNSKVLRKRYVKRLSTSLISRQLSFDGRMKNTDDE